MNQEGLLFVEGYDAAIIGIQQSWDEAWVVVYDKWAMVDIYMAQYPDSTWEDAVEDLQYNTWCAYYGKLTPTFLHTFRGDEREKRFDIEEYFFNDLQ